MGKEKQFLSQKWTEQAILDKNVSYKQNKLS